MNRFSVVLWVFLSLLTLGPPPVATAGEPDLAIELLAPEIGEAVSTLPVSVSAHLGAAVDPSTFRAFLDDREVTEAFVIAPPFATASLSLADGFAGTEGIAKSVRLRLVAFSIDGERKAAIETELILALPELPPPVAVLVPAGGGQVELPGVAMVNFPAGAFESDTEVRLSTSSEAWIDHGFDTSREMLGNPSRLPFEIRLAVGEIPAVPVRVELALETPVVVSSPAGVAFLNRHESDLEAHETFEWLAGGTSKLAFDLVPEHFGAGDDGAMPEAVLIPMVPTADLAGASGRSPGLERVDAVCQAVADVCGAPVDCTPPRPAHSSVDLDGSAEHELFGEEQAQCATPNQRLEPPLAVLEVTDPFGSRGGRHLGTDYRSQEPEDVYAMTDGVVTHGRDFRCKWNRRLGRHRCEGWGCYLIVTAEDQTKTLYAHLSEREAANGAEVVRGEVIGRTGESGSRGGPHLHVEYAPWGGDFPHNRKVDADACIATTTTGSIELNGPLPGPQPPGQGSYIARFDGVEVCRTTALGETATCSVEDLPIGSSLTLELINTGVGCTGPRCFVYTAVRFSGGLVFANGLREIANLPMRLGEQRTFELRVVDFESPDF